MSAKDLPKVIDARFVTTAVTVKQYPPPAFPEVAFVGRSNVGKSSMINTLCRRRKLVRVSNTPGRTRTLNFFDVDLEHQGLRRTVRFADLPGYGFAKASKSERASWEVMIGEYLQRRKGLGILVCIVDGEVGPTAEDLNTLRYFSDELDRKLLVVATKMDRLPKAKRKPQLRKIAEDVGVAYQAVFAFSAVDHQGEAEVWGALLQALPT